MPPFKKVSLGFVSAAAGVAFCFQAAIADPVEDFYKGKTITMIVSTGVGGVFDLTARSVARYMPKYLPGHPDIIVKNMPGAGHKRATIYMYARAARDGTFIGLVNNGIPLQQVVDGSSAQYDASKFNWIGSAGLSNLLTVAWHTTGVRTVQDVMTHELVTGATGISSNGYIYPNAMNLLLGTRFTIVSGYASSPEADLAMERGEINARAGFSLSAIMQEHPGWIKDRKVNVLFQTGMKREAALPNVPLMYEVAKTPEQREILTLLSSAVSLGRPFFTTPDVPKDRVDALRKAFDATMQDHDFVAEAQKLDLDIRPMAGSHLAQIVDKTIHSPADIVEKVRAAYASPKKTGASGAKAESHGKD
ncbi:MAG TPA: tripartite tricarboxylate transporter substrate-binding protein [Xanthobacteraceae bacterium]|jgi:tripartite-type tricarboxylate transporter receptor subunit TctC|nr:tripartite tricarboxylate transporter substrate-binding protein [Xanthobacteraceae bacterium]